MVVDNRFSNCQIKMLGLFSDSREYVERASKVFIPPTVSIAEIHAAVPKHLLRRSTTKSLCYIARDLLITILLYKLATILNPFCAQLQQLCGTWVAFTVKLILWIGYWNVQGLVFAGWWTIGHEAGHEALSPIKWVNHLIGFLSHTFLLVPYFSLRTTHRLHHKGSNCLERESTFVPRTRSYFKLPPKSLAHVADYHDIFEETPIYTLFHLCLMQLIGWHAYMWMNAMGRPDLPPWTNHFSPSSALFKPEDRNGVIVSNCGVIVTLAIFGMYIKQAGFLNFFLLYFIPYLISNHWVIMITYLHHSDPTVPYYRGKRWTFARGVLATVDRPLLGWGGRFFLHNGSHNHIAHHFFTTAPFYNLPQITECIKTVLKDDYNFDSTNCFRALYRTFTECRFIEDEGDVVFFKNKDGKAARVASCQE